MNEWWLAMISAARSSLLSPWRHDAMETLHTNPPKSSFHESAGARTAARFAVADRELRPAMGATATDEAFIELLHFYRCRGGIAREIEVLSHLRYRAFQAGQPASRPSEFDRAVRLLWGV